MLFADLGIQFDCGRLLHKDLTLNFEGATENERKDNARPGIAAVDNTRTFRIDHSDKFRSHFASVLVYCYLIFSM